MARLFCVCLMYVECASFLELSLLLYLINEVNFVGIIG